MLSRRAESTHYSAELSTAAQVAASRSTTSLRGDHGDSSEYLKPRARTNRLESPFRVTSDHDTCDLRSRVHCRLWWPKRVTPACSLLQERVLQACFKLIAALVARQLRHATDASQAVLRVRARRCSSAQAAQGPAAQARSAGSRPSLQRRRRSARSLWIFHREKAAVLHAASGRGGTALQRAWWKIYAEQRDGKRAASARR